MRTFVVMLGSLIFALTFMSCKKDKQDPEIIIVAPENHSEHAVGSTLYVQAEFKDDQELSHYKVFIGEENGTLTPEFSFSVSDSVDQKSVDFVTSIQIPSSGLESVYYLHFEVTDASGKSATEKLMLHFY